MRAAVILLLSASAVPAAVLPTIVLGQETRIQVSAAMRADIARHIRAQGFDCPDVKEVADAGRDAAGRSTRITCGAANGPPDPALVFRVSNNATTGRVRPWQP
jgi:hypothetical protein